MESKRIQIYCDSSVYFSCYVIDDEAPVITAYDDKVTNNEGEYKSVLLALSEAQRRGYKEVDLFTDSLLVVTQVSHEAVCRAKNLIPLRDSLRARLDNLGYTLAWVPREENPAGKVLE